MEGFMRTLQFILLYHFAFLQNKICEGNSTSSLENFDTSTQVSPVSSTLDDESTSNLESVKNETTIPKLLAFHDEWSSSFPQCSHQKNQFMTPINIERSKLTNVHKQFRTLFFYSYEPIDSYVLQTWYENEEYSINFPALSLKVRGTMGFQATSITGAGISDFQQFRDAIFFISKNELKSPHALHQLDGKKYPMEIMTTFSGRKNGNDTIRNDTHIFILVEIQEYDNPNYFRVIEAVEKILRMKRKKELVDDLNVNIEEMTSYLRNLTIIYDGYGPNASVEKLGPLKEKIKKGVDSLKTHEKSRQGLFQLIAKSQNLLIEGHYEKELGELNTELNEREKNLDFNITELTALEAELAEYEASELELSEQEVNGNEEEDEAENEEKDEPENDEGENEEDYDDYFDYDKLDALTDYVASEKEWVKHAAKNRIEYDRIVLNFKNELQRYNNELDVMTAEDHSTNEFIGSIINEINGVDSPTDGSTLLKFIDQQIQLKKNMKELEKRINDTKEILEETKKSIGWQQQMGSFQISWLFPDRGGLFIYNGSNPIPPCKQNRYTFVLEKTVAISQKQFDILTSIPSYDDGIAQVGSNVAPRGLAKKGSRPISHIKKNIQWLMDDGIHMKSNQKKKLKLEGFSFVSDGTIIKSTIGITSINLLLLVQILLNLQ